MRIVQTRGEQAFVRVLGETERCQAVQIVLQPGRSTGQTDGSYGGDEWIFVLEGRGRVIVAGHRLPIEAGTAVLIEPGEEHELENSGKAPLRTLHVLAPPDPRRHVAEGSAPSATSHDGPGEG